MRRRGLVWGQEAEVSEARPGLWRGRGGEDILGLGGLTLSPLALLISLTPAGEACAGRWGRRGGQ